MFSPSDLTNYMTSPFAAWMDRYQVEVADSPYQHDEADPLMTVLQSKGYEHEDAQEAKQSLYNLSFIVGFYQYA